MSREPAKAVLLLLMIAVALLLCLDVAYLLHGSLEEFPTPEQSNKIRVVTSVLAVLLLGVEVALWALFRRLRG
jgi:hypothetical protein